MDLELAGKTVLVTGASKGIGRAIAAGFAAEGCDLVTVARNGAALDAAAADLRRDRGVRVTTIAADLSSPGEIARVAAASGDVDVLVNNAGAIPPGDLLAVDDAAWRAAWDLKVFGYIGMTRTLYRTLSSRGGVVVNVIGSAGERAEPHYLAGSAGNAALIAFTRGLGASAPRDGVRVVGVNPGPVATDRIERLLRAKARRDGDESQWEASYADLAFGRPATPEEIANAVVFLASPRSSYTSGVVLTIDDPTRASL